MNSAVVLPKKNDSYQNSILFGTKLYIPVVQQKLAARERLDAELDKGLEVALTLVTAPAGFGKTTAVAKWIEKLNIPSAWFSIDSYDNSLKRFWNYLVAAFDKIVPGLMNRFSEYFDSLNEIIAERIVTNLINEIFNYKGQFVLVLDDYHLISEELIHISMDLLLKYMPKNAHIVIISRSQPPFVSTRLKTTGQVKEIRMADLQFTEHEIMEYCSQRGITLSNSDLKMLETYTEGWAAGLYLILESTGGWHNFPNLQSGPEWKSHRIGSYLTEEVLHRWAEEENAFMIKTSVLSSMTGSLCDALTGRSDGKIMLEKLSSNNAFIISLDNEGCWYRYHHLYAEFLRRNLDNGDSADNNLLHGKAGKWYEENGYLLEAVDHYLESGNYDKAAGIIEIKGAELLKTGCLSTLTQWLVKLPDGIIRENDLLCLTFAWSLALSGRLEEAEKRINLVESKYAGGAAANKPDEWIRQMRGEILAFRGVTGINREKPQTILRIIMDYKGLMNNRSIFCNAGINLNPGEGSLLPGMVGMNGYLSIIDREFAKIYESARANAIKRYFGYIPILMGEIHFERNHIDESIPLLMKGMEEAESGSIAGSYVPAVITFARIMKAKGDIGRASVILDEGEKKLKRMGSIHMAPVIAAFRARIAMETGDGEAVAEWMRRCCLDVVEKPSRQRGYEYITFIRALIFIKQYDNCMLMLSRFLLFVEKEQNEYYKIEQMILKAIVHLEQGQTLLAMETIDEALAHGEREGYERIFIEEGIPMGILLARYLKWHFKKGNERSLSVSPVYVRKLLKYNREYSMILKTCTRKSNNNPRSPNLNRQPLTKREKEVLRLLDSELTNAEIAATLDITVNTVKVNCTSIYRKLDVRNRYQATVHARETGLIKD